MKEKNDDNTGPAMFNVINWSLNQSRIRGNAAGVRRERGQSAAAG